MIVAITRLQPLTDLSVDIELTALLSGEPTKNSSIASPKTTSPINEVPISWISAPSPIPRNWMTANTLVTAIASAVLHVAASGNRIAMNSMMTTAFRARSAT